MKLNTKRLEAFSSRVLRTENCWLWQGSLNEGGYGTFGHGGAKTAHRVSFAHHNDELIPGMQIDHLCSKPSCVAPSHLEQVTFEQNQARSKVRNRWRGWPTHCKAGHEMDDLSTHWRANGTGRQCRICQHARMNEHKERSGIAPGKYRAYPNRSLKNKQLYELTAEDYEKADFGENFVEIFYTSDSGKSYGERDTMPRMREAA